MYNRYIPGANGIYQRQCIPDAPLPSQTPEQTAVCPQTNDKKEPVICRKDPFSCLRGIDHGDLLLLCIILLLLNDCDGEDVLPLLITAGAFLFLQ